MGENHMGIEILRGACALDGNTIVFDYLESDGAHGLEFKRDRHAGILVLPSGVVDRWTNAFVLSCGRKKIIIRKSRI